MGILVSGFSSLFYLKGSAHFRKTFIDIFMLISVFLFFGIGVDILHNQLEEVYLVSDILVLIEEGGEMIALSLLVWYFYFLVLESNGDRKFYLGTIFQVER
ncbi:hypothetical protein [Sediminicola luteus]|uniref:Lycopene cyclase domain-containing protein n=1 Tax=Sediminicola luteus TaxID=319238 RepID=A0ABV2TXU7_9FLAO